MNLEEQIGQFNQIGLEDAHVSIPNRYDFKYVVPSANLPYLLSALKNDYDLLAFNEQAQLQYNTTYFDTDDFQYYYQHHNGVRPRTKIRRRIYGASADDFLELKIKTNRSTTYKIREQIHGSLTPFEFSNFISSHLEIDPETLTPVLTNQFSRLFLVKKDKSMRMTIDFDLKVKNDCTEFVDLFPKLTVLEVKCTKEYVNKYSLLYKRYGAIQTRFSKYCLGLLELNPTLKQNEFQKTIRLLRKISLT